MGRLRISLLLVSLCLSTGALAQAVVNKIVVAGNHAPPFRIIENGQFAGIYFDIMTEIGKRLDVVVEYKEVPFTRALKLMESGAADIMLGPNRTSERETYMIYTNATIGKADKAFYSRSEQNQIETYEDLQGKDILVHRGKVYFERFDEDDSLNKQPVNSYQDAIRIMSRGRGDVIIMPEQEGDYLLNQASVKLFKSPYRVPGNASYITISRKSALTGMQEAIEQTFIEIQNDGLVEEILSRYRSD